MQVSSYASRAFSQMRQHLDFSQRQLAEHIGDNHTFVSRTESGETEPAVSRFLEAVRRANFRLSFPDEAKITPNPEIRYLSTMYAFNIRPKTFTKTTGDWHKFNYFSNPDKIKFTEIGDSPFGAWGIDNDVALPAIDGKRRTAKVANHIRAFLDLLFFEQFTLAGEALEDFIGTDEYDPIIFKKVSLLKNTPSWWATDELMDNHFTTKWRKYKRDHKLARKA